MECRVPGQIYCKQDNPRTPPHWQSHMLLHIDRLKTFKSLATHDFFTNLTCEARVHAVSGWYVTVRGPQPGPTEMNRLDAK